MLEINTVTVIGAGPAGRKIAQAAALGGFRTILVDILPSSLRQAQHDMRDRLQEATSAGRLSSTAAEAALKRLEFSPVVVEASREADLVIEAVPDELESKLEIFTLLDKICRPQTILASTTSSLSLTEIASITYRKTKIVGMQFPWIVQQGREGQLRIISTPESEQQAVLCCVEVGRRMGMEATVTSESLNDAS